MFVRRLIRWTFVAIAVVTILALAAAIALRTPWGLERTRRLMESRAAGLFDGDLRVGRLSGSVFGDVVMTDVTIVRAGETLIKADSIRVRYRPLDLVRGRFVIDDVVLTRPVIRAIEGADGWNLAKLAKPRAPDGRAVTFAIRRIEIVDGTLWLQTKNAAARELQHLALETGLDYRDRVWQFDIRRGSALDATAGVPLRTLRADLRFGSRMDVKNLVLATDRTRLTGSVTITSESGRREIDATIDAAPVALEELRRYIPAMPASTLVPSVRVTAKGPLAALQGSWTIDSTAGHTTGTFKTSGVDRGVDQIGRIDGEADIARLNLEPWFVRPALASRLTGRATFAVTELRADAPLIAFTFDGRDLAIAGYEARRMATRGTYRDGVVHATARGQAYGADVEAASLRWRLGQRDFQSTGRFGRVNLAVLPAIFRMPRLESDLAGQYDVTVQPDTWSADATFAPSVLEGTRIAAGTVGHADDATGAIAYRAKGHVDDLDLVRLARAWPELPRTLESLDGRIDADFDAEGRDFSLDTATLRGTVQARDTTIAGLRIPQVDATVTLERRRLVADLRGAIDRVEGTRVGIPEQAGVGAAIRPDLHVVIPDVSAPWAIDAVDATGTVVLEDLTYRGIRADRVVWTGALQSGVADIKSLEVTGPDLKATASGRMDLAGEDSSDLRYLIDIASLGVLQPLTSQSLRGTVRVEGRLQGTGGVLQTTANVRGHDLMAGPVQALTLESTVDAKVTDRRWAEIVANAKGVATFVQAGSARVDRVSSTVVWNAGTMDVDAKLESGARTAVIAGIVTPHPDHHEVHLRQLVLGAGAVEWTLPAGRDATIQYGSNRITVTGLDLARGDAILRVAGTLGDGAAPLVIRAERVDVADFNDLLLESQRLTGRLDATIELTGPVQSPKATAKALVTKGSIDGIAFEQLSGTLGYTPGSLGLDVALEAGTSGRLTVTGTVPLGTSDGAPRPYNLRVVSPGINLGLAQPLTPAMTGLAGTGRFDLHVSGTSEAPVLKGSAAIEAGAFTVPYTGMTYRNVNAAFIVVDRALTVERFTLEDEDKHVLTVTGKFNVTGGGQPGAFDLYFSGSELHVLKNKLGDVAISLDLHAKGDLQTPLVNGTIEVDHATIEVDDLIDRLRSTGYVPMPGDETLDQRDRLAPGGLGRGSYSVTLSLPDTVVLRGRNLRPTDGPIGLGAINVTVGGALSISKDPDEPSDVRGQLDVVRGQYKFQGRKFNIVRGSQISFRGDTMLDPTLNVTAERNITGVTARVRVTGTASLPEIQLSSTPPLDESDILSLIIFNEPANQLLASEKVSLAATAGTIAARAVATPLADSVARALNLDLFEIGPSEDVAGGATITVGQRIGDRLFVGFRHDFGAAEISQVSFEYKLSEFLRIVSTFADSPNLSYAVPRSERAGIDIFYVFRREP